jgi:hypothetical protein
MTDKEQRIKEQRMAEAIMRGLMGLGGKIACIATFLGSKIVSETPDFYSETSLDDVWDLGTIDEYDHKRIVTAEENSWTRDIGYIFDGLSRGMHLEIKYLSDERALTVYYKGNKVYREVSGDLECYAPSEWIDMIEKLFVVAKKLADEKKSRDAKQDASDTKSFVAKKIDEMRARWGL